MSDEWVTKQTLLIRARNQDDQQAWNEFSNYYRSFIFVILSFMKIKQEDKDDLCQEIMLRLWKNLEKFEYNPEKGKFRSWLKTIIRNTSIDFYRRKKRIIENEVRSLDNSFDDKEVSIPEEEELSGIIDREWRVHISNLAMERVEKKFAGNAIEVFKLTLEEVSTAEIAKRLDLAEGSISKLKRRVEEKLVQEIKMIRNEIEF